MRHLPYIAGVVEEILTKHALYSPPVDIERLLEVWEVKIEQTPDHLDCAGMAVTHSDKKIISVRRGLSHFETRFVLAHEFAHLLFDSDIAITIDKTISFWGATNLREYRANAFALELLMPSKILKASIPATGVTQEQLKFVADFFQVTSELLAMQLTAIQIPPDQNQLSWKLGPIA